jgi:hypothetical protein
VAVLSKARGIREECRRIVLEHHERLDGSGYPAGLKGLAISPLSEIVGIVDMYDAMLSGREGRPSLPPAQAIKELYKHGLKGHCDRGWIERTIRCLGIYPVGSLVELSTGERGVVLAVNPVDALRPIVKVIWDAAGRAYAARRSLTWRRVGEQNAFTALGRQNISISLPMWESLRTCEPQPNDLQNSKSNYPRSASPRRCSGATGWRVHRRAEGGGCHSTQG